jgi:hypothetical protein
MVRGFIHSSDPHSADSIGGCIMSIDMALMGMFSLGSLIGFAIGYSKGHEHGKIQGKINARRLIKAQTQHQVSR